jgi:hypothetical protein
MANINDRIKVKLTELGRSVLDKDVENTLSTSTIKTLISDKTYYPYHIDKDGYIEITLWDFMRIFGSHFWNGCPQIIENNEIIFLPKISQESAQIMFDEWVAYAEDCLHKNKWEYLSFPVWLGSVRKLTKAEINQVLDLVSSH